jgi:hypothetical protein
MCVCLQVRLEEDPDLHLPFLLPEDGYSCDTIRGVPNGLPEFVSQLGNAGLCHLVISHKASGSWTVYMNGQSAASDPPVSYNQRSAQLQFCVSECERSTQLRFYFSEYECSTQLLFILANMNVQLSYCFILAKMIIQLSDDLILAY